MGRQGLHPALVALLLAAFAVITALVVGLLVKAMAAAESAAVNAAYNIGFWYLLPLLSISCLVLGVRRRARLPRWLLLLAAAAPLAWIGLSQYMVRHDSGGYQVWDATILAWSACAAAVLVCAAALPPARRLRTGLTGLVLPVPLMSIILLLTVMWDVGHA